MASLVALAAMAALAPGAARADFWQREKDGILTLTNVPPSGKNWHKEWKVLFKTGTEKAASVRGSTDIRPPRDASPDRYRRYDQHIDDQVRDYKIPPSLVRAVIKTESDFDPNVVSSAGAQGLMQLMPTTARSMGVENAFDPRQNIFGGARYLQVLAQQFCHTPHNTAGTHVVCSERELIKVLAGYHAGPGAVIKYGGMPPFETTKEYVRSVLSRFSEYSRRGVVRTASTGRLAGGVAER